MSREDAIAHLGTIAKSGTGDFLKALTGDQKKDAHLIGQFGVGFYSAFIVADKVDVYSRRAGLPASEGVHWSSKGEGDFEVETIDKPERGTRIVLHHQTNTILPTTGACARSSRNTPTISRCRLNSSNPSTAKKKTARQSPSGKPSTAPARYGPARNPKSKMRNTRHSTNISRTRLMMRWRGAIIKLKANSITPHSCICPEKRRMIYTTATLPKA